MKILAVDTALGACSAVLLENETVLGHRWVAMERGHAEALAPMVQEIMEDAGTAFSDLDRLAVTTGPGTFTGQRVGLAFMRGLRIALKRPLIGITTLEAMITQALAETKAARATVLQDARRGEVYFALGSNDGLAVAPCLLAFEDAIERIRDATKRGGALAFSGTAGESACARFRQAGGDAVLSSVRQPDALWVARLALLRPTTEEAPRPLYLRPPDAKLPGRAG